MNELMGVVEDVCVLRQYGACGECADCVMKIYLDKGSGNGDNDGSCYASCDLLKFSCDEKCEIDFFRCCCLCGTRCAKSPLIRITNMLFTKQYA